MTEQWVSVAGYIGHYEVSNLGRVRSLARMVAHSRGGTKFCAGRVLKGRSVRGYLLVTLWIAGVCEQVAIHRLVASAFIPNPTLKPQVNHKDSNRSNNADTNLEWVTASENVLHGFRVGGRDTRGEKSSGALLTRHDVLAIRWRLDSGETCVAIARDYPVSDRAISRIKRRVTWAHV